MCSGVSVGVDHVFAQSEHITHTSWRTGDSWRYALGKYALGSDSVQPYFAIRITHLVDVLRYLTIGVRLPPPRPGVAAVLAADDDQVSYFCGAGPNVYGVCCEDTHHPDPPSLTIAGDDAPPPDTGAATAVVDSSSNQPKHLIRPLHVTSYARCTTSAVHNTRVVSRILSALSGPDSYNDEEQERNRRLAKRLAQEKNAAADTGNDPSVGWHLDEPEYDTFAYPGAVLGVVADLKAGTGTLRFYLNDRPLRVTNRQEIMHNNEARAAFAAYQPPTGEIYTMPVPVPASPSPSGGGRGRGGSASALSRAVPYVACYGCSVGLEFDNNWQPPPPLQPPPPPQQPPLPQ